MRCFVAFFIIGFLLSSRMEAQISLKTEYISSSKYHDENKNKNGGKGNMQTVHGNIQIPLSVKIDEKNRPTAWAVAAGGSYASLDNNNLSKDLCLSEILNTQIGIIHTRPIGEKWSILGIIGVGWFTSDLKHMSGRSILGQGGILFIKHARSNLDWGIGVALNNILGYPMIFPSFYLDWKLEGQYKVKFSMYNSIELSASMKISDYMRLGAIVEANGLTAAVEREGKEMIFASQYAYAGLQPEFTIGKSLSIPVVVGVAFSRDVYFTDRTIKAIFETQDEYPGFEVAPYCSVGLKLGF